MNESTAGGSAWKCERPLEDGTPCGAVAFLFIQDRDGTVHGLCLLHAAQRAKETERLERLLEEEPST